MASPHSVFGSDGDEHRAARGHVAALFTPAAVDAHRAAMAACATRHVAGWPRGRPFRLLPRLRALVDEIFTRVMLGVHDEQRAKEIADGMQRMLRTPGNPPLAIPGEGDGLLGRVGTAVFARKRAPLARLLAAEVASRRARETRADDVLDRMVAAEPTLSDEAIVDELLALLMAAQEPAAAALSWLLERLARRPDLPTSDAVVRETLRLRPAAIAALRRLTSPRDVAGHRLPAGALVMLPIPLLHRDPDAFRHPDDFRPERWAAATEPATYLPFGGGARRCLGEPLARAYLDTIVPAVRERVALRAAWPQPERMVLRGTILVPHRSGLMIGR
jgi:cytochrome P450